MISEKLIFNKRTKSILLDAKEIIKGSIYLSQIMKCNKYTEKQDAATQLIILFWNGILLKKRSKKTDAAMIKGLV